MTFRYVIFLFSHNYYFTFKTFFFISFFWWFPVGPPGGYLGSHGVLPLLLMLPLGKYVNYLSPEPEK